MRITDIISESTKLNELVSPFKKQKVSADDINAIKADVLQTLQWTNDPAKATAQAIQKFGKGAKKIAQLVIDSQTKSTLARSQRFADSADNKQVQVETTAGAVAGVAMGLGGGDPKASIYNKKPKKKTNMIKRQPMESNDE